ncbi:MAG TPA: arsenite methyltransferase [Saprospiraceae bacterium]|nr:arsenite methyltransferase [Saprospiraceae bacterium]
MEDLKQIVRDKYAKLASRNEESCCGPKTSCCDDKEVATIMNEDYSKLDGYVKDADLQLGCGIPTEFARIKKGDSILDLGSGAGNDVFVARQLTGESGEVFGVDFTPEMVTKAQQNKQKLGYTNVHFLQGDIEDLPIPSHSINVAISNCVMNLVPDKQKAYDEVFRVLKPGGHFSISDIVIRGNLPTAVRNVAELYAGCVSGATDRDQYLDTITKAGFEAITIDKERQIDLPDDFLLEHITPEALAEFRAGQANIYSINIFGRKPM